MGIIKTKSIIYRDCSDLPTHNFNEIRTTGNFMWMVLGYDGYNDVKVPETALERFENILEEYCELTGSQKASQYFELITDVASLELRYVTVHALLQSLKNPLKKETRDLVIGELRAWRFNFNEKKPFIEEYKRLIRQLRSAKTKIDRKRSELKDFQKKDEGKTILEQKVAIENIIGRNIDLKQVSVKEWVFISKEAEKIAEARKKWQNS